jgi:RNA polymerase sigma factor (sigma-70 family)
MSEPESIVFVVDDDPSVRCAIKRLIGTVGLQVQLFGSAQEFLASKLPNMPSCLVLDVRLPGSSGLALQRQLVEANFQIPIIFITAHGDVPMTVRAMKAGAVEFLTKPFHDQDLLDAIHSALERDRGRRQQEAGLAVLRERFESLSPREREVVSMVVSGMLNKQIAAQIGTAENTVKVHRSRAMEKMQANSLADLVKMIQRLQVSPSKSP